MGATLKELNATYGEITAGLMVILHFEWRGMDGRNQKTHDSLFSAGFPLLWIPKNAPMYASFIKTQMGIETDEDALAQVVQALDQATTQLGYRLNDEN